MRRLLSGQSVEAKFQLLIIPLVMILFLGTVALTQRNATQQTLTRAEDRMDRLGRQSSLVLAEHFWNYNTGQVDAVTRALQLIPGIVQIETVEMSPEGVVQGSDLAAIAVADPPVEATDLRKASFPITRFDGGAVVTLGELRLSYSLDEEIAQTQRQARRTMMASVPVAIALVFGTWLALRLLILRPILQVTQVSQDRKRQGADATPYEPIQWRSKDQLGVLVRAFNELQQAQVQNTKSLREERAMLQQRSAELEHVSQIAVEARDDALQANEAKTRFLATMSHELRTPLNTIIGVAEVLEKNHAKMKPEKLSDGLGRVGASGRHLLDMINQVLDLSKAEAGKMAVETRDLDINALVQETLGIAEPLAVKNGNAITFTPVPDLPQVRGDAIRIRQILLNLLSNAAKFTKNDQITLAARDQGDGLVAVSVTDHGIGITEEQLTRLFRDFEQAENSTARKFGGTGLGLSISRRLARAMDGDITATSVPNEVTTFTLTLPTASPEGDKDIPQ